jgi:hypothetical protein
VEKGYLASHASSEEVGAVIHYDPDGRVLSVEDPHLVFYLRNLDWQKFPQEVGFTNVELDHEYDFALSFAGENREVAEALYYELDGDDYVVFYDKNEEHRILGADVETYLAPIYERGCRFVIAVLGPKYGEKRWTIFESDHFKERFGDGNVIPIWEKNSLPSAFDITRGIGFLTFDPEADPHDEARRLAGVIKKKYDEALIASTGPPQIELDFEGAT